MYKIIVLLIGMLVLSVEDICYKSVSVFHLIIVSIVCIVTSLLLDGLDCTNMILGISVGACIVLLSVTTGMIGMADGIILGLIGVLMGWLFAVQTFICAITLMSCVSILLLIFRVSKLKTEMPFIPYMLLSAVGVMICA